MSIEIRKAHSDDLQDVQILLNEYYDALQIQVRDSPESTKQFLASSTLPESVTGVWLAYKDQRPVGCVVLRELTPAEISLGCLDQQRHTTEVKRLFVQEQNRGKRIADQLLDAVEAFARSNGNESIVLDSKDDLLSALKFYRRRGYTPWQRYNTNPQATIFMRKQLKKE